MRRAGQVALWALVGLAKMAALVVFIAEPARWLDAAAWLLLAWGLVAAALWLRARAGVGE